MVEDSDSRKRKDPGSQLEGTVLQPQMDLTDGRVMAGHHKQSAGFYPTAMMTQRPRMRVTLEPTSEPEFTPIPLYAPVKKAKVTCVTEVET